MAESAASCEIVSPLLRRRTAGKAAIVVVAHAGDEAPRELMGMIEEELRSNGLKVLRIRYAELAPNPVAGLVRLAARAIDVFSIVCGPETALDRGEAAVTALNIHRNTYAREGICAVFWLPSWGMPSFAARAANFLDFRTRLLEVGFDGHPLGSQEESPRFFVPPPPPERFFVEHAEDVERLTELINKYDRAAVVGSTYHGWPGGIGALVRACLHRHRNAFIASGGAFWIDGAAENWTDQLDELAQKMGAAGKNLEEKLAGAAEYLRANPRSLIVYDGVRYIQRLNEPLRGGPSPLELGGRVVVTTPREDLNPREFPAAQTMKLEEETIARPSRAERSDRPLRLLLRCQLQGHEDEVLAVALSPDGRTLASVAQDRTILLWNMASGMMSRTLEGDYLDRLAWSPDGRALAAVSIDHTIHIRDAASGKLRTKLEGPDARVFNIAWSPDGRGLASTYSDGILRLWNPEGGEMLRIPVGNDAYNIAWAPDGELLAIQSNDILLIDAATGEPRLRLAGVTEPINTITWSQDGRRLASALSDNTIGIWDPKTGRQLAILEGHTDEVFSVAFFADDRLLVSLGSIVRLWRCDNWASTVFEVSESLYRIPCAPIDPFEPLLVTRAGTFGTKMNVWEIDHASVLADAPPSGTTHYSNARVVLVGDTGVGKSGLALVLNGQSFRPTESTHGRFVWNIERREVELGGGQKELREILLWDLAGQPGYRLIHQLHLGEVAVALVVFDARSETDPFAGVRYWDRALSQARRAGGDAAVPMKKLLVAARADRGSVAVSRERIGELIEELGFDGYFETSAREGWQIPELAAAVREAIDWDALPRVSSTELFQIIKSFLVEEKETGRLLATADELFRTFLSSGLASEETEELAAQFRTCIGRVESRGLIRRLSFGDLVLLRPERLDAYAAALVNAARREPDGLGYLAEEAILAGRFPMPADERVNEREQEELLLIATVEELLEHEIALREPAETGSLLVFPSQFTRNWPEAPEPEGQAVIFEFEGPVLNVYTALVVRLARSGLYARPQMWRNAVRFPARVGGECGLLLHEDQEGHGKLTLFFSPGANEETRYQFEEYVDVHLKRRALPESLYRHRIFGCPECKTPVSDLAARRRRRRGHKEMRCGVCDTWIDLRDREERLPAVPESAVPAMDRAADAQRSRETATSILRGKIATRDFDVFLAYNSQDEPQVRDIAEKLKQRGLYPWLDQQIPPGRWFRDVIQNVIPRVRSIAIFIGPTGPGRWQAAALQSFVRQCVETKRLVIPVLLPGVEELPAELVFLRELRGVRFVADVAEAEALNNLEWGITGKARVTKVEISRLPVTGEHFVGREDHLARLDAAWDDAGVHVVSLVAWGGVGKTALVNRWLAGLAQDEYRGATRVMGWSFYSQGTAEGRVASTDAFIDHALHQLGDADPSEGSARDRGLRLATLLRRERTLLVLEGVEPLQHPPSSPLAGRLKDPALAALVRELAVDNLGLCVVTTRESVADLAPFATTTAPQIDLEELSPAAGAELLRRLGIEGTDEDLRAASVEFGGHALALTLLGNYLRKVHGGDVRSRREVTLGTADARQGGHAYRVIAAYEHWLGTGPELGILRLLGLFDRPAPLEAVAELRVAPMIPGMTESLTELIEDDWQWALANLREQGLLARTDSGAGVVDAHPLVRSYFADQLREQHPDAWRAGNLRLYEHLRSSAPDLPDTLEEMMPLFAAVVHGCRAGRQHEALNEVYRRRIQHGDEFFSTRKLGAFGSGLTALSGLFERPWDQPSDQLTAADQAFILNEAGFNLRALGRLREAVQPMRVAIELVVAQEQWKNAAIGAGILSELYLTLGDITQALASAEESVELADRSEDAFQRLGKRTTLADALHQAGRFDESTNAFLKAEEIQAENQPEYPRLHALHSYRYCDLLLGRLHYVAADAVDWTEDARRLREACREVLERATQLLSWEEEWSILDIALAHLSLGRAHLGLGLTASDADADDGPAELTQATEHLDVAVAGLRQAGQEHHLPRGLLARAALRRVRADVAGASADLGEGLEIAERGHMRLHECDVHLEWARLCRSAGQDGEARGHYERARALVEELGYRRREAEIRELGAILDEGVDS